MSLRKRPLWSVAAFGTALIGLQFTTPQHTNPPVNAGQTLEAITALPPDVSALFARSCNDCHSNDTHWRWYTYVAPVSWLTVRHVNNGRADWNVSEWGSYGTRRKETRLRAICAQVRGGTMPPPSYAFVHRDARLQLDDVKTICDWTQSAKKELEATPP
jgi:hypothetical protein